MSLTFPTRARRPPSPISWPDRRISPSMGCSDSIPSSRTVRCERWALRAPSDGRHCQRCQLSLKADFTHDAWTGVVAPAGTPRDVVEKLNRAINDGLQSAEMKENLIRFSAIAKAGTPQDFAAFMRSELPKWAELVKLAGATAE